VRKAKFGLGVLFMDTECWVKPTKPLVGILTLTLALAIQVRAQPFLTNGLVAYYPFSGNANDASGNGNDGALVGTDLRFSVDRLDQPQSSLFLNTTSTPRETLDGAYVAAPRSAGLDFNKDFSLSVWINLKSGTPPSLPQNFISNGLENNTGANLRVITDVSDARGQDRLEFVWYSEVGLVEDVLAFLPPVRETWWQATVVRSGSYVSLFKNGTFLATGLMISSVTNNSEIWLGRHICPGCASLGSYSLFGGIDDVRIYNRALSDPEVQQLYAIESAHTLPYLNLTINLTVFLQNTNHDNGVVTTTAAPRLLAYATKDILNILALDENLEGNWPSNSFPKSAKLALAGDSFVVVNGTNVLLNVSDIMSFSLGENNIISGAQNDATGLASHLMQQRRIARVAFDDTFIAGGKGLKFYLQGSLSQSTTDATPVAGRYTEGRTAKITNAAGDGSSQNVPFTCTGAVTASGRSVLSL
jgi:hypothetical protein